MSSAFSNPKATEVSTAGVISFDSGTYAQATTGTSLTFSHTNTAGNVLFVMGHDASAGSSVVTGITYGGETMTKVSSSTRTKGGSGRWITMWYLINPPQGANDVVVSASSSENLRFSALSYIGADTGSQPDNDGQISNDTTPNISITSSADNCWMLAFGKDEAGARTYSSTSGDTMRLANDAGGHYIADTGEAITPAGANDMSFSYTGGSTASGIVAVTIKPETSIGSSILLSS